MDGHALELPAVSSPVDADALVVALFNQEGASLVRLARLFTDDRNAAEDLVQEAFIRLHRNVDRIKDLSKAAPYLRSILLNLARDHNRRGLMSLRHQETLTPPDPSGEVDDDLLLEETQVEVISALEDLPTRQRECLLLRFYFELSEREIAQTLDISPNSVKTHCRRGMAAMRERLGEE